MFPKGLFWSYGWLISQRDTVWMDENKWTIMKIITTFLFPSLAAQDRSPDEWDREDGEPGPRRREEALKPCLPGTCLLQLMTVPPVTGLLGWAGGLCVRWGGAAPACTLVACSVIRSRRPCGFLQGEVVSPRRTGTAPAVLSISPCPCGY